jgi:hypothetical protein
LRPIVGDRIFAQYVDDRDLKSRYAMSIRIFIVNRVYLARAIVNEVRFGRNSSGTAQLFGGGDGRESRSEAPPAAAAPTGDTPPNTDLRKRLDELERKLGDARAGLGGSYDASLRRELGLDQTFARPVAIGYRYVSYERASNDQ